MMEAIQAVYPQSRLQRCIVHQIRSSTRFVSWKDIKQAVADLKKIYTSVTLDEAEGSCSYYLAVKDLCTESVLAWQGASTFLNLELTLGAVPYLWI